MPLFDVTLLSLQKTKSSPASLLQWPLVNPPEGAPVCQPQPPFSPLICSPACVRLDVRCQVDLRWKQCFEGTADEMLGHSEKVGGVLVVVVTWKCWRLTVRVLPSFPEICQRIQYIWIQTELTNPHYVASCVTPKSLFQSVPTLLYNKCCICSPGKGLWWVSALKCWRNSNCALHRLDYFLSGSIHLIWSCHHFSRSCFNYKPHFCSDESSPSACVLKRRMKAKEDNNIRGDNRSLSASALCPYSSFQRGTRCFYKREHALQPASGNVILQFTSGYQTKVTLC